MNSKLRKYMTIIILGLAGGSTYFLPYIKYIFYDAQIAAMGINNTQSGLMLTVYTVGNMLLYIPGGILADKLAPKKSLVLSLLATTALSFLYACTMNFAIAMVIWACLSFSTAFVFWSSLMKAIRLIGTEKEQGFLYGLYYACNGLTLALTNALALQIYGTAGGDMVLGFPRAVMVGGGMTLLAAILLTLVMKEMKPEDGQGDEPRFNLRDAGSLLKQPIVWVVSMTIFCGYGFYSCVSYFNPYLTAVRGISPETSGFVSIARNYLTLLLAPIGGILADKVFKSTCKWLATAFVMLSVLFAAVLLLPRSMDPMAISLYTLLPGAVAMMMYGVVFSAISEAGIPRAMTGTVIGIASIIGYMPDSIYAVMFGLWLDRFGSSGYNLIFGFLAATGIVGAVLAMIVYRLGRAPRKKDDGQQMAA